MDNSLPATPTYILGNTLNAAQPKKTAIRPKLITDKDGANTFTINNTRREASRTFCASPRRRFNQTNDKPKRPSSAITYSQHYKTNNQTINKPLSVQTLQLPKTAIQVVNTSRSQVFETIRPDCFHSVFSPLVQNPKPDWVISTKRGTIYEDSTTTNKYEAKSKGLQYCLNVLFFVFE